MKVLYVFLFVFCYAECRKIVPIDKNANLAFINMEGGGVKPSPPQSPPATPGKAPVPPVKTPVAPTPAKPAQPHVPLPTSAKPAQPHVPPPTSAKPAPVTKPAPVAKPVPVAKPNPAPHQIKPVPGPNPTTTPGPGSVKQLINFYDSQGKASPIRPYSYSQAVKQG